MRPYLNPRESGQNLATETELYYTVFKLFSPYEENPRGVFYERD